MPRRSILPIGLLALAAASCGPRAIDQQSATNAAKSAKSEPDRLTYSTTEAMCGTPSERALAIGRIAEDPEIHGYPDDVYSVADAIAEKGCPTKRR